MSVYNTEKYIYNAIESILNQTFRDFEFIIINDGSTDNSLEIIKSFNDPRIKIISRENRGLAYSLNEGIRLAQCDLIARMDPDDISLPSRLQKQIEYLEKNPDVGIVGTGAMIINEEGEEIAPVILPLDHENLLNWLPPRKAKSSPFFHGSVVYRKEFILKAGGYAEGYHFEDIVLWGKLSKLTRFANLPEILYQFRVNRDARTNMSPSFIEKREKLINKYIEGKKFDEGDINFMKKLENIPLRTRKYYYHYKLGNLYFDAGKCRKSIVEGMNAWLRNPILPYSYKIMLKNILSNFQKSFSISL